MPIFKNKVAAGGNFDGLTDATGLFDPGNNGHTGSPSIQTRINSLRFHSEGTPHTFELRTLDPEDPGNAPLILNEGPSGPTNDFTIEGMIIATADEGAGDSWALKFTTAGMDGDGWISIDFDFVNTEG